MPFLDSFKLNMKKRSPEGTRVGKGLSAAMVGWSFGGTLQRGSPPPQEAERRYSRKVAGLVSLTHMIPGTPHCSK